MQRVNGLDARRRQACKFVAALFVLLFILVLEFARRQADKPRSPSPTMIVLNGSRLYSPITMNQEWSSLGRLSSIVLVACFGATINGYFVTALLIQPELKRIGNVFLALLGLADMIVTAGVLPLTAIILLSGEWDTVPVCRMLQAMTSISTYLYSLFFTLVAGETYARVLHTRLYLLAVDIKKQIVTVVLFVIVLGVGLGIAGTYWNMDYDYCTRLNDGVLYFRISTTALHGVCGILTLYGLITSAIQIREYNRVRTRYRRSKQFQRDVNIIKLHITSYIAYALAWTPYLIVVYFYPDSSDGKFYQFACIGIIRSLLTSIYYGSLHGSFAKAYSRIFFYCCCKISMTTYSPRQRRLNAPRPFVPDVRTHILQVVNSPQRGAAAIQETIEL